MWHFTMVLTNRSPKSSTSSSLRVAESMNSVTHVDSTVERQATNLVPRAVSQANRLDEPHLLDTDRIDDERAQNSKDTRFADHEASNLTECTTPGTVEKQRHARLGRTRGLLHVDAQVGDDGGHDSQRRNDGLPLRHLSRFVHTDLLVNEGFLYDDHREPGHHAKVDRWLERFSGYIKRGEGVVDDVNSAAS